MTEAKKSMETRQDEMHNGIAQLLYPISIALVMLHKLFTYSYYIFKCMHDDFAGLYRNVILLIYIRLRH